MLFSKSIISISSTKIATTALPIISACFEFHISKYSRIKYQIADALFESSGNVIFPNFRVVREFANSINTIRGVTGNSQTEIRAGYLNAVGLLDEISHFLVRIYDEQENPGVVKRAYQHLESILGKDPLEKTLLQFVKEFPPKSVYKNLQTERAYFDSVTSNRLHREIALEELVMLYLSNINPANKKIKELFDDTSIAKQTQYSAVIKELELFFANEKPFGPDNQPLLEALKKPMLEHPENIEAQLGFLKERWGIILAAKFTDRITSSFEYSKEEEKFIWHLFNPFQGKPNVETFVPEYKKDKKYTLEERNEMLRRGLIKPEDYVYAEPEQFTPDTDWMPNVVLIAKNTYVWLDQLSKKYQKEIKRLDQIPDEELDQLARWNFTSLWLIGVWERSTASKRIKQITGNLDAVSSAYSLYDYEIAYDLGGEESFQHLNRRCWQRGIRLAGDMVPNHMGLFSKWVIEHPEYFIQSDHPPYPNYRFSGENLSQNPHIDLRIEDGYWSRSDAAVVFQRTDRGTGAIRYFYHGNDGTSMPWNDTAQLNLLRADVREAVIQNIFHVARKFSVIRFDAAMTLAKKHFQRLWYPMAGTSGVPSRQDHSLSRSEFDAMFPNEFWREVVDRFNTEMPQTLLLAEAFWLMEGYFVRTLGMHRVYNSAFMHMLMKEENQKFRAMIKNTLEFNPEILKRYVNFMSNPDEQTAVEQFGKDDKYFGVATLMITLPGLPMFAHGQIEGFNEKYGMEYQRAYYNETPDEWLIRRHEHEIFPLTKKRFLFSQVQNFELYDFLDSKGFVNEDVIAYSNCSGSEKAVIFFHNKFSDCKGYIKHSLPKAINEQGKIRSITLAQSLQFRQSEHIFYRFRDRKTNLEYLITGKNFFEKGMHVELRAFEYAVFMDFQEISDETGSYASVAQRLNGKGTGSLDSMLKEFQLRPFHRSVEHAFKNITKAAETGSYEGMFRELSSQFNISINYQDLNSKRLEFLENVNQYYSTTVKEQKPSKKTSKNKKIKEITTNVPLPFNLLLYDFIHECKNTLLKGSTQQGSLDVFQQLHLDEIIKKVIVGNAGNYSEAENIIAAFKNILKQHSTLIESDSELSSIVEQLLNDFDAANFLAVNQHNDIWYFNKEQFATLMQWVLMLRFMYRRKDPTSVNAAKHVLERNLEHVHDASIRSEFKIEKLKELLLVTSEKKRTPKIITKKGNKTPKQPKKKQQTAPKKKLPKKIKSNKVKSITKGKSGR